MGEDWSVLIDRMSPPSTSSAVSPDWLLQPVTHVSPSWFGGAPLSLYVYKTMPSLRVHSEFPHVPSKTEQADRDLNSTHPVKTIPVAGGGGGMRSPGLAKKMREKAEKCGGNAENAAKNAIENAVLLEWCMPLETPMFHLVLHDRALKAWTV